MDNNELKERLDKLEKYVYEELPTYLAQELREQLKPIEIGILKSQQDTIDFILKNNK